MLFLPLRNNVSLVWYWRLTASLTSSQIYHPVGHCLSPLRSFMRFSLSLFLGESSCPDPLELALTASATYFLLLVRLSLFGRRKLPKPQYLGWQRVREIISKTFIFTTSLGRDLRSLTLGHVTMRVRCLHSSNEGFDLDGLTTSWAR